MKVYISGPISGTDDYMERFAEAQKDLEARGYEVVNPALINSYLPISTIWDQYMDVSLALLSICDAFYMLPGWEKSRGASLEYAVAKARRKAEITYEDLYL